MEVFKIRNMEKMGLFKDRKKLYALFLILDAYFNSKYCKIMDFIEFCEFANKKVDEMDD